MLEPKADLTVNGISLIVPRYLHSQEQVIILMLYPLRYLGYLDHRVGLKARSYSSS